MHCCVACGSSCFLTFPRLGRETRPRRVKMGHPFMVHRIVPKTISRGVSGGCFDPDESWIAYCFERVAQAFPLVVAAAQRAHAVDAEFVEGHGRFGRCSLAGTGAEEHDIAVARNLIVP